MAGGLGEEYQLGRKGVLSEETRGSLGGEKSRILEAQGMLNAESASENCLGPTKITPKTAIVFNGSGPSQSTRSTRGAESPCKWTDVMTMRTPRPHLNPMSMSRPESLTTHGTATNSNSCTSNPLQSLPQPD